MSLPEHVQRLEDAVKQKPLPRHVGIIMDGNGRWAELRGQPRLEGHREGSNSVRDVTRCARRIGVQALTLYAFSSQNWSRPAEEVAGLMDLLREYLEKERAEIMDNGIRLNAIGEIDKLPKFVKDPLQKLREDSSKNTGMWLTLALSYGGREELVRATRAIAAKVQNGDLQPSKIDDKTIDQHLWTYGLPELDLVIRSSGESRISNFLLWQAAYAEFVFTETLWPDLRTEQFLECVSHYQNRERRFGLTGAQLKTQKVGGA